LFNPDDFLNKISGFIRLVEGDHLILGREDDYQQAVFDYPETVSHRHLSIIHEGDALVFKDLMGESGSILAPIPEDQASD